MASQWQFDRSGDHLALDFANTVSDRASEAPIERLGDYAALLAFARQCGLAGAAQLGRWSRWARRDPAAAVAVHAAAQALRDALYRLFLAVGAAAPPGATELALLNDWWHRLRLGPDLEWHWADGADAPDALLAPVVRAAVELLRSGERERIRRCGADDCGWLFHDTSKNRTRRWCDMKSCGNREKARRFYERQRDQPPARRKPRAD